MSLELKTKDQDAALIVLNLKFGIKGERDLGYTSDSIPNSNILYSKNSSQRNYPFWNSSSWDINRPLAFHVGPQKSNKKKAY